MSLENPANVILLVIMEMSARDKEEEKIDLAFQTRVEHRLVTNGRDELQTQEYPCGHKRSKMSTRHSPNKTIHQEPRLVDTHSRLKYSILVKTKPMVIPPKMKQTRA
jgi:hypothetical protein